MQNWILAIDIGGTFTDVVAADRDAGQMRVVKVLTSYPDPSLAVLAGVRALVERYGVDPARVGRAIHGTTLVTNALIERKGARLGLITTEGFRDALEIGREGRYDIYDLFLELPEPLVERRLRIGVPERLTVRGEVIEPLDEAAVRQACEAFIDEGVEAVAVSFIHAYTNPSHELAAAQIVAELLPEAAISVSHEVAPEMREYDRTSTTAANAYVQPLVRGYLESLSTGLSDSGIRVPMHIMLSNGGSCSSETAAEFPVRLVESGPCGGALAAAHWSRLCGLSDTLAFDMGGTTAKAVIGDDGVFPIATESEVARVYRFKRGSGLPLLVPVMDMIEVGAGGGSIAHLNEMGLPTVGPESAGSDPGPVCYGQGGSDPTVTDADLVLGLLDPYYFLGGEMRLDEARAREAVAAFGTRMEMDTDRAAWGIHQIVNENMANAARVHAAERGIDLKGYAMVATGGAGPVHACGVAERLGIGTVIVPPAAGVGSAFGLMLAPISFDYARSYVSRLEGVDLARLNSVYEDMEKSGLHVVADAGVGQESVALSRRADLRYVGQGHEIRVDVPVGLLDEASIEAVQAAFDQAYTRIYGRICEGVAVEAVHWRLNVSGPRPDLGPVRLDGRTVPGDAGKRPRSAILDDVVGRREVPVYDRYQLEAGLTVPGPVIVEEAESTTVVPEGWTLSVHASGALKLEKGNLS